TMASILAWVFTPVAILIGVDPNDIAGVADLLGTKLVANEMVAFVKLNTQYADVMSERSQILATYALTGFANFGSIGIQLGGIGGMAPARRGDLARLSSRALLAGFIATLINACVAAMLL
ncbi:MAG: nucleoside transporter C-terminal domain-containing protein, partial [Vicinamibacterales bacterium]